MEIPPEIAWIVPVIVPLIIGLLVGAIIRRTIKLATIVIALVVVLVATGCVSFGFQGIYDKAMEILPELWEGAQGLKGVLPYSSVTFLIGLALGLWKG